MYHFLTTIWFTILTIKNRTKQLPWSHPRSANRCRSSSTTEKSLLLIYSIKHSSACLHELKYHWVKPTVKILSKLDENKFAGALTRRTNGHPTLLIKVHIFKTWCYQCRNKAEMGYLKLNYMCNKGFSTEKLEKQNSTKKREKNMSDFYSKPDTFIPFCK